MKFDSLLYSVQMHGFKFSKWSCDNKSASDEDREARVDCGLWRWTRSNKWGNI